MDPRFIGRITTTGLIRRIEFFPQITGIRQIDKMAPELA